MNKKGHVTVVLGGMAGSEGKGKFAGYLAAQGEVDLAMANFMPNAGHTWVDNGGEAHLVQQLPQAAAVDSSVGLVITAGAAIELPLLLEEIKRYNVQDNQLIISPRAMIIEDRHREAEAEELQRISSTLKGCGHALADKVSRGKNVKLAGDIPELDKYTHGDDGKMSAAGVGYAISDLIKKEPIRVMVECPQGFDLDINHGLEYPYCTSRQTTSAQALADAGIAPQLLDEVIAVIRPYPIRVGDAFNEQGEKIGTSGSYADSAELSWEEIAERGGIPFEEISEFTTVTKKLRRVFEIDWDRLRAMVAINGVTQIALNFANYIDWEIKGKSEEMDLTPKVLAFMQKVQLEVGVPVTLVGTGAKDNEIIDLRSKYGK